MVNAVMDAIALLSSLASDLDVMLNDLRSSSNTRLIADSPQPENYQNSPATPANSRTETNPLKTPSANYLQSVIKCHQEQQDKLKLQQQQLKYETTNIEILNSNLTSNLQSNLNSNSTSNSSSTSSLFSNHQGNQSAKINCKKCDNNNMNHLQITTNISNLKNHSSQQQQQQQQHNHSPKKRLQQKSNNSFQKGNENYNKNKNNNNNNNIIKNHNNKQQLTTTIGTENRNVRLLNPIGKSPSSSFISDMNRNHHQHQHQQLLQLHKPQKLHMQLLQQQQATKAIAVQLRKNEQQQQQKQQQKQELLQEQLNQNSIYSNENHTRNSIVGNIDNNSMTNHFDKTTTIENLLSSITTTTSSSSLMMKESSHSHSHLSKFFDKKSCDCYGYTNDASNSIRKVAGNHFDCNWWLTAKNLGFSGNQEGSSDSNSQISTHLPQTNQLKANINNVNATNANTNIGNNNNNNNNISRHLPFCGLDSIKGSDNNGKEEGSSGNNHNLSSADIGQTNLNFDLQNLQNSKENTKNGIDNNAVGEQFDSIEANESSYGGEDGHFEDDMQALLPKSNRFSRDELSQSRTSLVSSSDGGILAEGETSSETSRGSDDVPPCDLGLLERLLLTHPIWFLSDIQRSGAVHFLQGKEEGNFIVRGSSQPNTMAVSVRLPPDTGPYIEHYLIQSMDGKLCLESSRFKFDSIPNLIAHYAQCCDELPVQLILPRAVREAKNRQMLSSLALLGQEFWRYPMSCPKANPLNEPPPFEAKSPNSYTETSGLGATMSSNSGGSSNTNKQLSNKILSPISHLNGLASQVGTPSDTTSSMSSFTTSGILSGNSGQNQMQILSPESVDSVILTMSPVDLNNHRNALLSPKEFGNPSSNLMSTFKSNGFTPLMGTKNLNGENTTTAIRQTPRPKPPNTLNLDLRKPPAPPMRWSKPVSPHSPTTEQNQNNFTVTTTVTFSMENKNSAQMIEVMTPAANNAMSSILNSNSTFQTFSKRLSPEGECKDTLSSQGSSAGSRWPSQSSKDSNNSQRKILSPATPSAATPTTTTGVEKSKSRKAKARKESKHYQESDILESPQIYCQSALGDKISDYEDLWTQDANEKTGLLTSFKPKELQQNKRPDLLAETPSLPKPNGNGSANGQVNGHTNGQVNGFGNGNTAITSTENHSENQQLIQFSGDIQPRSRAGLILPGLMSQSLAEDQFKAELNENDSTTPTTQTPISRSKQGSPFYAEPADALQQAANNNSNASILRRSQKNGGLILPAHYRHSEPPKSGIARWPLSMLLPTDIEKIAGSFDELKKKQASQQSQSTCQATSTPTPTQAQPQAPSSQAKRNASRLEQWQLDSSWEFMAKQDDHDDPHNNKDFNEKTHFDIYDCENEWKIQEKENFLNPDLKNHPTNLNKKNPTKTLTVYNMLAKRLPELDLPELIRCSTPQKAQNNDLNGSQKSIDSSTSCRLSSYDNVERNHHGFNVNFLDSAQSDDGTVFSEPWDSSQWDANLQHDDTTMSSDTIHISKCRAIISEDDTIDEDLSTKEINNQDTLKAKKTNGKQKVATILRNPSIRDREILSHPRNKINSYGSGPGDSLKNYTLQLAKDPESTFAQNIENFISCTKESREAAPQVVMRNMRQFMNGMKNYLVKHGEGRFHQELKQARTQLKDNEFLNMDAILETVMHQLVVLPLKEHLYGMFIDYYTRSGEIQLLAQNVKHACNRNPLDFGIHPSVTPPSASSLLTISNQLLRLQEAELPLEKLDQFLCVISTIYNATSCPTGQKLGADDFLPILVYVVAKCGFFCAEIEAEFMWGLLQPTLLNGEPGYYLTALCSAVHVLKSFMSSENESGTASLDWRSSSLPACSSVLRVIIPDECNGSLQTRTLPVRPHTTTREVCRIIAHKARITNPQDYALFKLEDGEETLLNDSECPQDIRFASKGKHCMLAYKRIDAKIAWPILPYSSQH